MMDVEIHSSMEMETPRNHVTLLDLAIPVARNKGFILKFTLAIATLAAVTAFLLPNKYKAEAKILPPQQAQSSLPALLGQINGAGMLAGLIGKDFNIKSSADLYIGVLKSRSVSDAIIQRFDLMNYYHDKNMVDARRDLADHTLFEAGTEGLITISMTHKNPQRAAEIANAYVEELYEANKRLAISEASQRRLFFEQQLDEEKKALAEAEAQMKNMQETTGLIKLDTQAEAIIRSVTALKAQLAGKEVEYQAMKSFATDENPERIRLSQEIAALRDQVAKAERSNTLGGGNIDVPTGKIPQVGLEYVRKFRDVKYHESLFEVLAKQYEAARIDEGRNAPIIQIVDKAIVPDKKSSPSRAIIIGLSVIAGFLIACLWVWTRSAYSQYARDPRIHEKLMLLKEGLSRTSSRS